VFLLDTSIVMVACSAADNHLALQVADNAEPMAKEFNEQQLQPAAEYIAKNFEREARRLAKEVGPLAEGLPKAMRRAVELNKASRCPALSCHVSRKFDVCLSQSPLSAPAFIDQCQCISHSNARLLPGAALSVWDHVRR